MSTNNNIISLYILIFCQNFVIRYNSHPKNKEYLMIKVLFGPYWRVPQLIRVQPFKTTVVEYSASLYTLTQPEVRTPMLD
jgi:hypothetical protein